MTEAPRNDTIESPPLPPGSEIVVVEDSPERLLIHVPSGGPHATRSGGVLLFFSFLLCLVSYSSWNQVGQAAPLPFLRRVQHFAVQWATPVAAVVAFGTWFRMQFERTSLLVEQDRFAIQKTLLGWRRIEQTTLDQASRAMLVELPRTNGRSEVAVKGGEDPIEFGRLLSGNEQVWLVQRINQFLRVPVELHLSRLPERDPWADVSQVPLLPAERSLPALHCQSGIRVLESTFDRLTLFIPGGGPQAELPPRWLIFWGLAASIWTFQVVYRFRNVRDPYVIAFLLLGCLAAISSAGFSIWKWLRARNSDVTLRLDQEHLVLERHFRNRSRIEATPFIPGAHARVTKAYRDARLEVFEIVLSGRSRELRFGMALSTMEKDWLEEQINAFLEQLAGAG